MFNTTTIMGVLNVTPDSFYDGNKYNSIENAKKHIQYMVDSGVNIIDVGGESTRPGAELVSLQEEIDRVIPVIEYIKSNFPVLVSVDTSKAKVMELACSVGVDILNDVRAFTEDNALDVAVKSNLPICIMHMKGSPKTMQINVNYNDVVEEILSFLQSRIDACIEAGVHKNNIIIDPGFGFGKTLEDNIKILNHLDKFKNLGYPVLVGFSRKSMIGKITGANPEDRLPGSLALNILAHQKGARIFRVHDVFETKQALQVLEAV